MFKKPSTTNRQPSILLIGLGNPGKSYAANRHNVGFMALDEIAARHGFSRFSKKFQAEISEGTLDGRKLILLKPLTYMNLSGESVAAAARFHKIPPENIIVFHDELDLPPCKIRVKKGGGNGGHNGLKSIDAHIGKDYWRVRIGISHPGDKDQVSDYVLSDFSKAEMKTVEPLLGEISHHLGLLIAGDEAGFMNKIVQLTEPKQNNKKE